MRRILIVTGVLGGGTALTFAVAAFASTMLPGGVVIPGSGSQVAIERGWARPAPWIAVPEPAPIPPDLEPDIRLDVPAADETGLEG